MRISIPDPCSNGACSFSRQNIMWNENNITKKKMEKIITRTFKDLNLEKRRDLHEVILEKVELMHSRLRKGCTYRKPRILVPLAMFIHFRLNDIDITKSELLAVSEVSRTDVNDFLMQLKNYLRRKN